MMRWHPILFKGPMIRALLAGLKTQTRRIIDPQPHNPETFGISPIWGYGNRNHRFEIHAATNVDGKRVDRQIACPYGMAGDRLWVRETLAIEDGRSRYDAHTVALRWDDSLANASAVTTWKCRELAKGDHRIPAIHMPRWASRISLEITAVRVERLLDITDEDAIAEGLTKLSKDDGRTWKYGVPDRDGWPGNDDDGWHWERWSQSPRDAYLQLWDDINGTREQGKYFSARNPWVWRVEFKRIEDARAAA